MTFQAKKSSYRERHGLKRWNFRTSKTTQNKRPQRKFSIPLTCFFHLRLLVSLLVFVGNIRLCFYILKETFTYFELFEF